MRNLASIRQVAALSPIPGKDRIVLAQIDGWQVIVKKDEFQVGDLCVYIEIDSVLPERPEFEFLRDKKFRIKTLRLGGVLSQGICFPMSILPPGDYALGQDVTDVLGVRQYVPTMDIDQPAQEPKKVYHYPDFLMRWKWFRRLVLPKKQDMSWPPQISKTDEVRIQNIPAILNDREKSWVCTEKVDGSSGSFLLVRRKRRFPFLKDKFDYIVCSRNLRRPQQDGSCYWAVSNLYDIPGVLKKMIGDADWVALQGEIIGPKIQGNKYGYGTYDLFIFNVLYPDGRLPSTLAQQRCCEHHLRFVPILGIMTLPPTVDEVLKIAHGESKLAPVPREGLVFRSLDGRDSFKAVDPLFLLKYDE